MRVVTWNVNSIRARRERLVAFLERQQPDVVCLQELKCEQKELDALELAATGYQLAATCQKTYNGVAILSKLPLEQVSVGLGDGESEEGQARLIAATVSGVRVYSAYFPNGQTVGSDKWAFKLRWMERLRAHLDRVARPDQPLALCGDFNVAPEPIDVHAPEEWESTVLYHPEVREKLRHVQAFGLVDAFRLKRPEPGLYSWWDYRMLSFPKGKGLRIDHVWVTEPLAKRVVAASIDRDERKGKQPSDHAPVIVDLE